MSEPVRITTVRWVCPHCSRGRSKRAATEAHIARCWDNPDNATCRTCRHAVPAQDACGCSPGCNWGTSGEACPPTCDVGREVPADGTPVVGCPLWEETGGTDGQ